MSCWLNLPSGTVLQWSHDSTDEVNVQSTAHALNSREKSLQQQQQQQQQQQKQQGHLHLWRCKAHANARRNSTATRSTKMYTMKLFRELSFCGIPLLR